MKHVQPFSLTIEPVLGECETSLAARLAFRNGIPRLVTFCSFLGLDYLSLANGEPDTVRYIARLAGRRGHVFDKPIPVPEDQMAFERYLVDRIDGQTSGTWLDQLPFHVASQTCETFGLLLTQGPKAKRALASPQEWLEAGLAGYKVLKDGPEAFIGKLAEIAAGYPPAHAKT